MECGSISEFCFKCLELTSEPEVLNTVKGHFIEFTTTPYRGQVPAEKKFSSEESNIYCLLLEKLVFPLPYPGCATSMSFL